MASIEDRIVQMQFDNAAFERKLSETISSIQRLNTTLANAGSSNGLQQISNSAKNFNLNPVGAAIDGVSAKFLALSTVAITVLSNIVSKAFTAGVDLAKALTLDPIIAGFQEYELQIGSIQTILANTSADGTNLTQVNAALDELNEYSDKTIYNFGQMTKNIGTFTAAGVDLDTSVQSIKGIANLAAISGSSSEQASTAMYQLSQAMASGTVKLMDWNSVVNAGMGGEIFQKALFETGKMMGTIANTDMSTTFEEWTAAGNTFRGSLEDGWLTSEVLTTTLQGFTGEMTEAQLTAIGYTQEQAAEIMRLGEIGVEAATKVRTLTQMISTTKEALQSGWSQSFRTIFGDFEEATTLWTGVSDTLGGFIQRSADARNALLEDWSDMGGRDQLIEGLKNAFKSLMRIMDPIQEAFRTIFPRMTAQRLFDLTARFNQLMKLLYPGPATVENLRRIFTGFFSALKIGWTILKEGIGFVKNLIQNLTGLGSGGFLEFIADFADVFTRLKTTLVDGGGIAAFFDGLSVSLDGPIQFIKNLKDALLDLFDGLSVPQGAQDLFNSLGGIFGSLASAGADAGAGIGSKLASLWDPLKEAILGVVDILDSAWETISTWFSELGQNIADTMGAPDFDAILDVIDTALLGGIAAILAKFLSGGLNLDFGNGFFGNISDAFGELSGTLQAMQTNLKAEALLKIAGAIGIIALSVALLATIDPEKMTDALAALAIGFGQLIGAFALINKLSINITGAVTLGLIATGMILLAGAMLVLVAAVKLFSMMDWDELGRGLAGVGGGLAILTAAVVILSRSSGSMITTGLGMIAIAVSLLVLAGAVKLFSMMDWDEIGQGLVGVAGALAAVALGMHLMPKGILLQGAGLILVGAALMIIAQAVKQFADMEWEAMGQGLTGIAGALTGIALATYFMSPLLPLVGAGLILVAISLDMIADVMKDLAEMSWEDIGKGLAGIAGALTAIVLAMSVASGSVLGAAGIIAMAFALGMIIEVVKEMAGLSWGEIIKGVGGLAAVLGVLGLASLLLAPVAPAMLAIGAAIILIGGGFALFGLGVASLAKGFQILASVGTAGIDAIIATFSGLAAALPQFLEDVGEGILAFADTLLKGMPDIIDELVKVLQSLLEGLITLIPDAVAAIELLIIELLAAIRAYFPDLVQTGIEMILALLQGIRDNIFEITTLVAEIITEFLDALALKVPELIDSVYNLLIAVIEGVIAKLIDIGELLVPKGIELIQGLWRGITENKEEIIDFFQELPGKILGWIGNVAEWLLIKGGDLIAGLYKGATDWVTKTLVPWLEDLPRKVFTWIGQTAESLLTRGANFIVGLYNGIIRKSNEILIPWLKDLPRKVFTWIGKTAESLLVKGMNFIVGLYNGLLQKANEILVPWLKDLPRKVFTWIGNTAESLLTRGANFIVGLYNGIIKKVNEILIPWLKALPGKVITWIGSTFETLLSTGKNLISGLYNGAIRKWNEIKGWFDGIPQAIRTLIGSLKDLLVDIGKNVIQGLYDGAWEKWESVKGFFSDIAGTISDTFTGLLGIDSPSKVFMDYGGWIMEGLYIGLNDEWETVSKWLNNIDPADSMDKSLTAKMTEVVAGMATQLQDMDEFQPIITPVLDLTQVRAGASALAGMIPANASYIQASAIARSPLPGAEQITPGADQVGIGNVQFEQNIYAPKQLSTGDIYRQTRNQIVLAKEELNIP